MGVEGVLDWRYLAHSATVLVAWADGRVSSVCCFARSFEYESALLVGIGTCSSSRQRARCSQGCTSVDAGVDEDGPKKLWRATRRWARGPVRPVGKGRRVQLFITLLFLHSYIYVSAPTWSTYISISISTSVPVPVSMYIYIYIYVYIISMYIYNIYVYTIICMYMQYIHISDIGELRSQGWCVSVQNRVSSGRAQGSIKISSG